MSIVQMSGSADVGGVSGARDTGQSFHYGVPKVAHDSAVLRGTAGAESVQRLGRCDVVARAAVEPDQRQSVSEAEQVGHLRKSHDDASLRGYIGCGRCGLTH